MASWCHRHWCMLKYAPHLICIAILWVSAAAFAQAASDPATPAEVIESGQAAWSALAAGKWALGIGSLVTFTCLVLRAPWLPLASRIPARWRTAIPLALSGVASAILVLAGEAPLELAALLWPATAGVAIGVHETGETLSGRRYKTSTSPTRRRARTVIGILLASAVLGWGGSCHLQPPTRPAAAGVAAVDNHDELLSWCRGRQERRWWSSALAQAAGVLAAGLAGAALARDDDRVELGLEIGGLVSAGLAAGAQTYSGAQAGAYEQHCTSVP